MLAYLNSVSSWFSTAYILFQAVLDISVDEIHKQIREKSVGKNTSNDIDPIPLKYKLCMLFFVGRKIMTAIRLVQEDDRGFY